MKEKTANTDFNIHSRMRDLDEQFNEDKPTTFKTWEAFLMLNYPSLHDNKTLMRMLRELYNELYLEE